MALTPIEMVRVFIADRTPPYMFSDQEIQEFLDMSGGSVRQASIYALYATISDLAKNKSIYRETTGDIEVWSNAIDWYKLLLTNFNDNPQLGLGAISIYAAGIDNCDFYANKMDLSARNANIPDTKCCSPLNCLSRFAYGIPDYPSWVVVR